MGLQFRELFISLKLMEVKYDAQVAMNKNSDPCRNCFLGVKGGWENYPNSFLPKTSAIVRNESS